MKKILLLIIIFISCNTPVDKTIKEGDIIFQESQSSQGVQLKLATQSRYTHMGIIFIKNKKYYVLEAVQPVRIISLNKWINRGKNKHYIIKRIKNRDKLLTKSVLSNMEKIGKGFLGKKYDSYFLWSDKRIYCSELVWKVYNRGAGIEISELEKFRDFNLSHPLVNALIKKRFGKKVPFDETVVSPVKIFNSDLLETVRQKNLQ